MASGCKEVKKCPLAATHSHHNVPLASRQSAELRALPVGAVRVLLHGGAAA